MADAAGQTGPEGAPRPGDLFAGKYTVDRMLGVGGMGFVFAATHVHLREPVAIKMLLPRVAANADTVERFLREGRAAVKIKSEHVVRILDVAELPDRTPYMVMERLEGKDLQVLLREARRLPYARAIEYVLQACEAVAMAHALKTIHRDLKPSNLFVARLPDGTECVKVLDFGISKMSVEAGDIAMTKTTDLLGSPLYMSPEQLRNSKEVDERADVWALGVILYELVAGRPPFMAQTLPELGALVLAGQAPSLATAVPDAPPALVDAIASCLRSDPAARLPNVAELADAIAPLAGPTALAHAERIRRSLGIPHAPVQRPSAGMLARTTPLAPPPAEASAPNVFAVTPTAPGDERRVPGAPQRAATIPPTPTATTASRSRVAVVALPLVGAFVIVVGGGLAMTKWHRPQAAGSASVSPSVTEDPPAPLPSAAPSPPPSASALAIGARADAAAVASVTAVPSAVASAAPPPPRAATRSTHAATMPPPANTAPRPAASVSAPARPKCDPPYELDSSGAKHWKKECL